MNIKARPVERSELFYFMAEHHFDKVNIDFQNVNIPNGMGNGCGQGMCAVEAKIKALGGVDLQLLGNRSQRSHRIQRAERQFDARRTVNLTQSTIEANKRFFASEEGCAAAGVYTMESRRSCRRTRF